MSANRREGEPQYRVTKILEKRVVEGEIEYLVIWHGTDGSSGEDWEPEDNLVSEDPRRCEIKLFNRLWDAHQRRLERKKNAAAASSMEGRMNPSSFESANNVPALPAAVATTSNGKEKLMSDSKKQKKSVAYDGKRKYITRSQMIRRLRPRISKTRSDSD